MQVDSTREQEKEGEREMERNGEKQRGEEGEGAAGRVLLTVPVQNFMTTLTVRSQHDTTHHLSQNTKLQASPSTSKPRELLEIPGNAN